MDSRIDKNIAYSVDLLTQIPFCYFTISIYTEVRTIERVD